MKCGVCDQREAVVAVTHEADGAKQMVLLCRECAEEKNIKVQIDPAAQAKDAPVLVKEIKIELTKLADAEGDAEGDGGARCAACEISYDEFKKIGRLGCPGCYEAFAPQLEGLLKRIHGDNRYRGKGPQEGAQSTAATDDELERLRGELAQAVAAEAFETAAQLRDRIRVLGGK